MKQSETWLSIKGYEGLYEVSNLGNVRSLSKYKNNQYKTYLTQGKLLKPGTGRFGYKYVYLTDGFGVSHFHQVHRLVLMTFTIMPEERQFVNHKNGIKANNELTNLEWCTKSENTKHAYDTGIKLPVRGENNKSSKLKEPQIVLIRNSFNIGEKIQKIAADYGVNYSTIDRIVKRITWSHV